MTFGEYWKNVRTQYDTIIIQDQNGELELDKDNSDILEESEVDLEAIKKYNDFWKNQKEPVKDIPKYAQPGVAGYVEIYYEMGGTKLSFMFPYEQEIKINKDHICAETIDIPGEKIKIKFYKKNKLLNRN